MFRRWLGFVAALAVLGVGVLTWRVATSRDERTRLLLDNPYGQISSGEKMGVVVGESWTTADRTMRARLQPKRVIWTTERPDDALSAEYAVRSGPLLVGEATATYTDESWRSGTVRLHLVDGRVARISWNYYGPFSIDF